MNWALSKVIYRRAPYLFQLPLLLNERECHPHIIATKAERPLALCEPIACVRGNGLRQGEWPASGGMNCVRGNELRQGE